ncbi:MAG: pyridoxal phosphate-dependent aminotransferase [Myxococcaceae bacterium]
MKLSSRVLNLAPSATLGMKARAKVLQDQGIKIISLSAGEPDFETPACIIEAAHQGLDKGVSRYTGVRGTDALIAAMRLKFKRDQGVDYASNQVLSSVGAKSSLSHAIDACLEPGDEAIILKPYWVSYPDLVKLAGATPVFAQPNLDSIRKAITPNTRAIFLNSPNNPDGSVLGEDFLRSLMHMLEDSKIWVISDEIYEHLVFDGVKHVSPASFSQDAYERTLVISGVSKGYAMTGWRVGIAGGPEKLVSAMAKLQEQRYTCVPAICQTAAVYALNEPPELKIEIERMRTAYQNRRDEFLKAILKINGLSCETPQGAFYAMVNFSKRYPNDLELADRLLNEAHVATVAGTPFGAPGYLRIGLAASLEEILMGVEKIAAFLERV